MTAPARERTEAEAAKERKTAARVRAMTFATVYPLYVEKAEKKGRSRDEVDALITWLTGYPAGDIRRRVEDSCTFETFFAQAPAFNPLAVRITGVICGYRVEEIEDEVVRKVRYLDKLVDELAKGRPMEKILRSAEGPKS